MNLNGTGRFKPLPPTYFLPQYFDSPVEIVEKSLEQQTQEALAFRQRLQEASQHGT